MKSIGITSITLVTLLQFLSLYVTSSDSRKVISLYCPDYSQHPSIMDAIKAAIPSTNMPDWLYEITQSSSGYLNVHTSDLPDSLHTITQYATQFLHERLYLTSWLSDSHYQVIFNETMDSLSFQDVFVVQESHFKYNLLCQVLPPGIPYVSSFCHCDASKQFQHSQWINNQYTMYDREKEVHKARWCVRPSRCTSSNLQVGKCDVHVDPVRRSCLLLQHHDLEPSRHWDDIDSVISYEEKVPMMVNVLPTGWKKKYYHPYHQQIKQVIVDALSRVPYYLFNLVIGLLIMYYARDLAEDPIFHFFLEAFIGVFFALFVLAFLGKKVVNSMMGAASHASFGLIPIPALFSVIYLVVTNPMAAAYVRDLLYDFWDNGAFGFPWLGKVYFTICITLSLSISKYFRLFDEDSSFAPLMIYSVKVIGILFLCNSSSSREICLGVVLIGLFADHFRDWISYAYFMVNAKPPRYVANQRKMSEEEFAAFQSANTKKHLEALRSHLRDNNRELFKNHDLLRESGKANEADLLKRFVSGSYDGKPRDPNPPTPKKKMSWLYYILIAFAVPVILAVAFLAYSKLSNYNPELLSSLSQRIRGLF